MDSIESYLRKLIVASVGAADLGCEKLGKLLDECVARGEVTVEKGRVLNEELKRTCKQAAQCINAQQQTNYQRSCHCHDTGNQHFLQCCCCGNFYAFLVVGLACTLHDAGDGTELSSYFFNHFKCSFPYGLHCECREQEGQHTTNQQTDDNTRIQHVDCGQANSLCIGYEQSQCCQCCGTDCEAFTHSCCCVTNRVKFVCDVTN